MTTSNFKVRVNPTIAYHYRSNDIEGMPDYPGTWIYTAEQYNFIRDIVAQDLQRWKSEPAEWQDRNEIKAWERQLETFGKAVPTDAAAAEPAGRQSWLEQVAAAEAQWLASW